MGTFWRWVAHGVIVLIGIATFVGFIAGGLPTAIFFGLVAFFYFGGIEAIIILKRPKKDETPNDRK